MLRLIAIFATVLILCSCGIAALADKDADTCFAKGQAAYQKNKANDAIIWFTRAIRYDSKFDQAYYCRALTYWHLKFDVSHNQGDSDNAARDLMTATRLLPDNGDYVFQAGMFFGWDRHDFNAAIGYFNRAIQIGPQNEEYWFQRGRLYADYRQRERGIEDISKAISMRPDRAMYYITRARYYIILKRDIEARADLKKTIELEPNSPWADEARRRLEQLDDASN